MFSAAHKLVLGALALVVLDVGSLGAEEKKKPPAIDRTHRIDGTLAAVDLPRNAVRIVSGTKDKSGNKTETDQTLPLATDARILLQGQGNTKEKGKPAAQVVKLGDLKEGMRVFAILSEDKKTIRELSAAYKENLVMGGLKSADPAKRTMILISKSKSGEKQEEEYVVAADAIIQFHGHDKQSAKAGTLGDLREKMSVTLKLTEDGKSVVAIRVAAPIARGVIKDVDAAKSAITITVGTKDNAMDVPYALGKAATVRINGSEAKLDALKPGTPVELLLSPDDGSVVGVRASDKDAKNK